MLGSKRGLSLLSAFVLMLAAGRAEASFHLWTISEVFSDASGTIQFVELSCAPVDGENLLGGLTIVASQGAQSHTFTFPGTIAVNTSGKKLLIATAGYAALPGVPAPDFQIPNGFLFGPSGSVSYASGISIASYTSLPTDGSTSLNFPGGTSAANSPTNFAGATGPVVLGQIADPLLPIVKGNVTVELQPIAVGLVSPLGLAVPDDGSRRLFLYDQTGAIQTIKDDTLQSIALLNVASRLVSLSPSYDERGLLGVACHPDFAHNPKIYTYNSEPNNGVADFTNNAGGQDHQNVVAEWTMTASDPNALTVNPASRREILRINHPAGNHNGGSIRFGPDGFLYIGVGDGGSGDDQGSGHVAGGNGQSTANVYGKILRIDVDKNSGALSANGNYSIPPGNPFVGVAGVDEIFAYGFRNPFSFSFDAGFFTAGSFKLYVGDVGQNSVEESDLVTPAQAGGNYGWPVREGGFWFDNNGNGPGFVTSTPPATIPPNLIEPIAQYDHGDGISVIGGFVDRSSRIPALDGRYVFGDLGSSAGSPSGRLIYIDGGGATKELRIGLDDRALGYWIKGFGQDANGDIYVCGSKVLGPAGTTGALLKLAAPFAAARQWALYP